MSNHKNKTRVRPDSGAMQVTHQVVSIDRYAPNYNSACMNCEQTPTVTGVKGTRTVYESGMCGPCTWGESACLDPEVWNESPV